MKSSIFLFILVIINCLVSQEESDITTKLDKPDIILRQEWNARQTKETYTIHTPQKITIHHTYRPLASDFSGSATVKQIQDFHMDSREWADIGYHFVIGVQDAKSFTFQGRPENVVGAHARGANTNNVGISVIGDYNTEAMHPQAYMALIHLVAWLCEYYKIDHREIYGHRDFGETECPGSLLYSMIPQVKKDVEFLLNMDATNEKNIFFGVVFDEKIGIQSRISGAKIAFLPQQEITTDENGVFKIEMKSFTNNECSITCSDYHSQSFQIRTSHKRIVYHAFGLTAAND